MPGSYADMFLHHHRTHAHAPVHAWTVCAQYVWQMLLSLLVRHVTTAAITATWPDLAEQSVRFGLHVKFCRGR